MAECEVEPAENRDILLLVTDTDSPDEDQRLRVQIEGMNGIQTMVLCFGDIDPETTQRDPLAMGKNRRLPTTESHYAKGNYAKSNGL